MTFLEKLKIEHPEDVNECVKFDDGHCPDHYKYEKESHCSEIGGDCKACWNREMPEESNNGSNAPIHFDEIIPDSDASRLESYTNTAMHYRHNSLAPDLQLFRGALGLAGESGEVCDLIKKYAFQGHPLEEDKLVEELGDTLWYLAHIASTIGITLAEIMDRNIAKLVARYPNGRFEAERSINREEAEK